MIYLLLGPSGSGKDTLAAFLEQWGIPKLISHTTRQPRKGEVEGKDYYFVSRQQFEAVSMIESTEYSDNLYGTAQSEVDRVLSSGGSAYAIIDKPGVYSFKAIYGDQCKVIYVWLPLVWLVDRLQKRGDSEGEIRKRVKHAIATGEMENFGIADYIIVNRDLEESKKLLRFYVGVND